MKRKNDIHPPALATRLLKLLLGEELLEEFEGDLLEIYQNRMELKGRFYATLMYWVDVIHLTVGFFWKRPAYKPMSHTSIWRHYFLVSWRNLVRNKGYAMINITSLAVGMGVCMAIAQYVFSELNHDHDIIHIPQVYRLTLERNLEGSLVDRDLYTAHSLATVAKEELPDVESFTRLYVPDEGAFISESEQRPFSVAGDEMLYVDGNFLDFFQIELLAGDSRHALDDLYSVVISERIAERLFGDDNPIGKIMTIGGGASHGDYQVTGVFPDRPADSHLQFNFLFPIKNFMEFGWLGVITRYAHAPWFITYFQLNPQAQPDKVCRQLDQILLEHKAEWNPELTLTEKTVLQPLSDIHLDPYVYANGDYVTNKGSRSDVNSLILVAAFILIIAWFNYINLSTARSLNRAKEVGIRKSLGAKKVQLIYQFLSEALTINFAAALLAVAIGIISLELLASVMGKPFPFTLYANLNFWLLYLLTIVMGSLFSGYYPAFLLSRHQPMNMLSSQVAPRNSSFNMRRVLVTFQFLISLLLIAGTYLVYKQIDYMKNEDLGMDMDQVLVVRGPKHIEVLDGGPQLTGYEGLKEFNKYSRRTFGVFRSEMLQIPSISSITGSWSVPGEVYHTLENEIRRWGAPESENQSVRMVNAGLDFIKTYDLELVAGNTFTPDLVEDRAVILNEKAVKAFGFASPEEAVGDRLAFGEPLAIIGVVKDYHWQSLKEDYSPWILWFSGSTPGYISLKVNAAQIQETIPQIEEVYDQLYPGNPFEYFFIDDRFNRQYQADLQFGNLFLILTLLAILIACIGLFALISYSATMRVKEIGVRKVLGASVSQIMMLLSREYFRLLALAIVLATPLILYIGKSWLDNYAFRIDMGPDIFILPGCALVLISIITVSHRTLSAAKANPVDSLRSE